MLKQPQQKIGLGNASQVSPFPHSHSFQSNIAGDLHDAARTRSWLIWGIVGTLILQFLINIPSCTQRISVLR